MKTKTSITLLLPLMVCFFAMGFVDMVGIASNYIKADLSLNDSEANIIPSLVFLWFLIFAVPTSMLMNRIGRKSTVMVSLTISAIGLAIPTLGNSFNTMLLAFSVLGIGNALMQTSLNALASSVFSSERLATGLTFGQFVKAAASFTAPYLAMWGATAVIPTFGLGWRVLFLIYMLISLAAMVWLSAVKFEETKPQAAAGFLATLSMLKERFVLLSFIGIICVVGIDVGVNTTAPKILMERVGMSLSQAGLATSLYFIARTFGCLSGAVILQRVSAKLFFTISIVFMAIAMGLLFFAQSAMLIYICIAVIGYTDANTFPIIFSQALLHKPENGNEISGLMIMGLIGGTLFPLFMGISSDLMGQNGAIAFTMVGVLYLLSYIPKINR